MIVSVICTVRNGESIIGQTIESIMNQSFQNWEMVVVDDGSDDNTLEILKNYHAKDSRINYISSIKVGRAKALNIAINSCNGEFIANIDCDDPSHPNRLEFQLKAFEHFPKSSLITTKFHIILDKQLINWDMVQYNREITDITQSLIYGNSINHSSIMIKKNALLYVGGYNEKLQKQLDYDLWLRLVKKGICIHQLNVALATKRIHKDQSFENKNRLRYLFSSLNVQKDSIIFLKGGINSWILLFSRMFWGIMPQKIRLVIRGWIKK
ncbi:glycosyltransferase family 2 protein [Cohnella lupini]|uniref:Glycosyl transferase family 2 n=1 Tax=Cohnella lupini TaxID=1294267 RepID=A0A3D9IVI3_9BACL|nr:glycosyltransferase family 2 protein [Cohnella lupini]RED65820.1 glycosyl transferase family 2 [Cohnella lupini]